MANKKGFTLLELVITIALLLFITPTIYSSIMDMTDKLQLNDLKSRSLSELTIINTQLANLIKNSYGIVFEETNTAGDTPTITLWQDKQERTKIKIFIDRDLDKDISRIMVSYNGGSPLVLHSTNSFIEYIHIQTSPNPKTNPILLEDQPWLSFDIKARTRSPLEQPTDDKFYSLYDKSDMHLYGRFLVRNYVASSLKQ